MATYYVDAATASTDFAAATNIATPCTVQTALTNAAAGDIVRFLSGDYFPPNAANYFQPAWRPTNSGTSGNPITFISHVRHGANIHDAANQGGAEGRCGFGAYDVDWIVFDGFTVTPHLATGVGVQHPFQIDSCQNVHVQNFAMTGWEHTDHTNGALIGVYGNVSHSANVYIHHNDLSGVTNDLTPTEAVVNAAAIYIFEADNIYVYNNTIHDCNNGVAWKTEPHDIHVYNNFLYNVHRSAFFPTIEVSTNNSNHYVHHNVVLNCGIFLDAEESPSGGGTWSNLQVYNNTMHNDASHSWGTVYVAPSGTASVSGLIIGQSGGNQTARGVLFYNNIFSVATTSRGIEINDNLTTDAMLGTPVDYNAYYISSGTLRYRYNGTSTTTFSTYQTAINDDGEEANSSTSNPVFLNGSGSLNVATDFKLNPATSPYLSNGYGGVERGAWQGQTAIGNQAESGAMALFLV